MKDLLDRAAALSTSDLDELIAELGKLRATKLPEVTYDYGHGKVVGAIVNPAYRTDPDPLGSVLGLRHPGFGWCWFLIPPNERENLLRLWTIQKETHLPPLPPNKLN